MSKQHNPLFVAFTATARSRVRKTDVGSVKQRLDAGDEFILVDVREDSEWAMSCNPKSIHIGKGVIERDIETHVPDLDAAIVLYCGGGYRSALAADAITQMGYTNVESMDGGFSTWTAAGFDIVEKGE